MASAVLLLALGWTTSSALAQDDGRVRFDRASDAMAESRHADAAAELMALADQLPDDSLADDALFAAGTLFEEKLSAPERAAEVFARLVERYPDSRVALAAKRRLERLRKVMRGDDDARALAAMNDILYADPPMPLPEAIAAMEALMARAPSWTGAAEAKLWLSEAYARAGRTTDARRSFEAVADRWPESGQAFEALRQAATLAARDGAYDHARSLVEKMRDGGDPGLRQSVRATRELIDREELRAQLYTASFAILAAACAALFGLLVLAAGGAKQAAGALARPPTEVWYMAPVALGMVALATTGHADIAPAVGIILAGGLVLAWLSGAVLREDSGRRRWLLAAVPGAAVAGVVAVCYIAIHRTRLVDLIISTVRFGPDV